MRNEEEYKKLQKDIQFYCPKELRAYDVGLAMTYPLLFSDTFTWAHRMKILWSPILKEHYAVTKAGKGNIICLFGASYTKRKDQRVKFEKVVSVIQGATVVEMQKNKMPNLRYLLQLWRVPCWIWNFRRMQCPWNLKLAIVYTLFDVYCQLQEIIRIEHTLPKRINSFVCWCDVHLSDFLPVQHFNQKGVKTVTLQHAHFNEHTLDGKLAYLNSPSRYFLCYGNYTKKIAESLGVPSEKMIPVGIPGEIGNSMTSEIECIENGQIGVILSFFSRREENICLLEYAKSLAERYHLICKIRPHPSLEMADYAPYIVSSFMVITPKEETMEMLFKSVSCIVLGSTDVFATCVLHLKPVFRLCIDKARDYYLGIEACRFENEEQFFALYTKSKEDNMWMKHQLLQIRSQLIAEGETKENYKRFFTTLNEGS